MHRAISDVPFGILDRLPLVGGPARRVRQAHDLIADGVYAAIRRGGGGLLDVATAFERPTAPGAERPGRLASSLRSAINGAFGDHLAAAGSILAVDMALCTDGRPVAPTRTALATAWPQGGRRLALFIHGLGCDERCWDAAPAKHPGAVDIPRRLAIDCGFTPLYLRYNTGLAIADNGRRLSTLLDQLLAAWPQEIEDLLIVGHSMGGLLARSAFDQGMTAGCTWPARLRRAICLGTPHLGSAVERLGELTTAALRRTPVTAPLARVAAARSAGIQDLRHGPGIARARGVTGSRPAWCFVGGSLDKDPDSLLGRLLGDGLVTPASATAHEADPDMQSLRLGGVSHMGLLNDARVLEQIRAWIGAIDGPH